MPPGNFVGKVVIRFVFLDRSAESCSCLHARVGGVRNRAERVYRLEVTVAQVAEDVAMKVIRSGTGNDVHHSAGSAAIFRRVSVGDDLKFLNRLLRNGRAHAVGRVVGGIGAIHVHQIGTAALSAYVESRSWRGAKER